MKTINYDIDFEPIVIHKATIDKCLSVENSSDCIALYTYYYYTAKWQKEVNGKEKYNTVYAVNSYIMNQFNWGKKRVVEAKNNLEKLGLIKPIIKRDEKGVIVGHYIRIIFMYENNPQVSLSTSGYNPQVSFTTGGGEDLNTEHTNNINTELTDKSDISDENIPSESPSQKLNATEFFSSFRKNSIINSIPAAETYDDTISSVLNKWKTFAKNNNLSSVLTCSKNRISLIKKRLKEKLFDFDKILDMINKSDYLLGKKGGWKIDLDWIIRDDINYIRILEGKYTNNIVQEQPIEDKKDIAWNKTIFNSFIVESGLTDKTKRLNIEKIAKNLSYKVKSLKGYDIEFDSSDSNLAYNPIFNNQYRKNVSQFMNCKIEELKYKELFIKNLMYLCIIVEFAGDNDEIAKLFRIGDIIDRFVEENNNYMIEIQK